MTYEEALRALKGGERVARRSWRGKLHLRESLRSGKDVLVVFKDPSMDWDGLTPEDKAATDWYVIPRRSERSRPVYKTRFERLLDLAK